MSNIAFGNQTSANFLNSFAAKGSTALYPLQSSQDMAPTNFLQQSKSNDTFGSDTLMSGLPSTQQAPADLTQTLGMLMTLITTLLSQLQKNKPAQDKQPGQTQQQDESIQADQTDGNSQGGCQGKGGGNRSEEPAPHAPTPAPGKTEEAKAPTPTGDGNGEQQEFLDLVNKTRAEHGLKPVKLNSKLNQAATDYSGTMSRLNKMSHEADGTKFGDRAKAAGYGSPRGENVAQGYGSVKDVFEGWMNSPGHKANILMEDATEIGLGRGENNYWTNLIGNG